MKDGQRSLDLLLQIPFLDLGKVFPTSSRTSCKSDGVEGIG